MHDGRERVGKVALLKRLLQLDDFDAFPLAARGNHAFSHASPLSAEFARNKLDQAAFASRASAAIRAARASGNSSPRGSNTRRARKNSVSAKPAAISSEFGRTSSPRRNAGSDNSRSFHGSPALPLTALPDFG